MGTPMTMGKVAMTIPAGTPGVPQNTSLTLIHIDDLTPAIQHSLYKYIDFDKITTLNEAVPDSGKAVVAKPWEQRFSDTAMLQSDADEELLMFIPSVPVLHYPSKGY